MTKPARITQADMTRATMAAADTHKQYGVIVRVIFHLQTGEIETVIGDTPGSTSGIHVSALDRGGWEDE